MLSTRKSPRSRRTAARIAVAGVLAAVPIAAVAVPAFADEPAPPAGDVDWPHHDGLHHRHHGPGDGPGIWPGGPGPFHPGPDGPPPLPPTGSFG